MKLLVNEVLAPLALRVGTFVAGYMSGIGASDQHAEMIGVGVGAAMIVAAELVIRKLVKRD